MARLWISFDYCTQTWLEASSQATVTTDKWGLVNHREGGGAILFSKLFEHDISACQKRWKTIQIGEASQVEWDVRWIWICKIFKFTASDSEEFILNMKDFRTKATKDFDV